MRNKDELSQKRDIEENMQNNNKVVWREEIQKKKNYIQKRWNTDKHEVEKTHRQIRGRQTYRRKDRNWGRRNGTFISVVLSKKMKTHRKNKMFENSKKKKLS